MKLEVAKWYASASIKRLAEVVIALKLNGKNLRPDSAYYLGFAQGMDLAGSLGLNEAEVGRVFEGLNLFDTEQVKTALDRLEAVLVKKDDPFDEPEGAAQPAVACKGCEALTATDRDLLYKSQLPAELKRKLTGRRRAPQPQRNDDLEAYWTRVQNTPQAEWDANDRGGY